MVFPTVIPASVLGSNAPSKRINIGVVGVGNMGIPDMENAIGQRAQGAYVLAVCDVDGVHRRKAAQIVNDSYEDTACREYGDFREITRNPDIDAVIVATPDHWHALPAIDAVRHGKDIYVEKPLTLTVEEGRVLVAEMRKHKRIGQTGTQQRSGRYFLRAAELVRNGRLGKIRHVDITIPSNNR
ncbi:MAG: Gfo/Idh/MocA family oxidoreductase [Puniceicoccales bacterium]|jgi:predicted dehydrogenase|nr:Gfo/Idh/MocA family oxidoreductase [Puniceicoccales bacterium]